jgi:hypothetical protein
MKTKVAKTYLMLLTKDHITFIIGNDQILQNKLESAVSEGKDFNFYLKAIGLISSSVYTDNYHHWCLDFMRENVRRRRRRKRTDLQHWKIKQNF